MKPEMILPLEVASATLEEVGGKGASLARMAAAGLPVPGGFHVTTDAYRCFVTENHLQPDILEALEVVDAIDPQTLNIASQTISKLFMAAPVPSAIARAITKAYMDLPGSSPAVAVRSSATAEDLPEASFAGQQDTYLNVSGVEAVLEATRKCWASLWTARAIGYRARQGIPAEKVALAVVVQRLVFAEAAGILFTANPLNGQRDQIMINASWGLGESIVGGSVSPDTLIVDKTSGRVIQRETAEKLVQTVRINAGTREISVPANLQNVPVLSNKQAEELSQWGNQIEELFGIPMDIEWTFADGVFAVVQARPITALPDPEPPVPTEWRLPKGLYAAMRNNIVELMADPLTPLFRTLGLSAVNASMNRMMNGFMGSSNVLPEVPIISVNEYAYYNGSVKFLPMMKVILDTRGILRRMFTGAVERWTETGRPEYIKTVKMWESCDWESLPNTELLGAIRQLAEAAIDAYGALVSGVIPAAWMSEAWFTLTYKLFKRKGDPIPPTYLLGFDSLPIRAEKSLYDLANWTKKHPSLAAYLLGTDTKELVAQFEDNNVPPGVNPEEWRNWTLFFQKYLADYGHAIYNLDFGSPVPADDPAPLVETFRLFLRGEGTNPYERQKASVDRRTAAVQGMHGRLKGFRRKVFQKNLERAQKYAPLREDGLADVGLSYPLLRKMLRMMGVRFVEGGLIDHYDDIFWLTQVEVEEAAARLDCSKSLDVLSGVIPQRKAIWRAARRAAPPLALPQIMIFGKDLMALKTSGSKKQKGDILKGVPASPGNVTASACVIRGPEDFSKMKTGDVLVAPLTTPAWTPLFARASAVVTDVGGPLSHGSIVAREYGIPAVLGTGLATKRIRSGQMISVDGSSGVVTLIKTDNPH